MRSKSRRYEVLFPIKFNDGQDVLPEWVADAGLEIAGKFGGASFETQHVKGLWLHDGVLYQDDCVRLVVEIPDLPANRQWMKDFKSRWKAKLRQLEIWMISYTIEIE